MRATMKFGGGLVMLLAALAGGCASDGGSSPAQTAAAKGDHAMCHAQCLVCKYNADLACIDVEVEKATPSQAYEGKTYYFCSESCAKKFGKDPAKYVNQK